MPKDVASDNKDIQDSLSPPRDDTIQSPHVPDDESSDSDMEGGALDEDDEREQSLSVPASPTLVHRHVHGRLQRLRSQSFDDIASSVNNEEDLPPSPSIVTKSPVSHITGSTIPFQMPPTVNSASESDTEGRVSIPRQGLGVVYNNSLTGSQPELTESPWGAGKFNQFKGKFLQKFKRGYNSQKVEGLQVPQPTSDRPTSGSGSDVPQDTAEETNSLSHMTHRLLAVGQRFRNSPPSLLRRMSMSGCGSPTHHLVPPISGSETGNGGESRREAREKSKSNFITL